MNIHLIKQLKGVITSSDAVTHRTNIIELYMNDVSVKESITNFYENSYLISCFVEWLLQETKELLSEEKYETFIRQFITNSILATIPMKDDIYGNVNTLIYLIAKEAIWIKLPKEKTKNELQN